MLLQYDSCKRVRYANRACRNAFGAKTSPITGQGLEELIGAESFAKARPFLDAALAGSRVEFELELTAPRTGSRRLSVVSEPQRDDAGMIIGCIAALDDVTHRTTDRTTSSWSEERHRTVMNALPYMVWMMRPDRKMELINSRLTEYIGKTIEEVNRDGWLDLIHSDDQVALLEEIHEPRERGRPHRVSYRLRRFDGEYRWVETYAHPIKNSADGIEFWLGSTTDVHERYLEERKLRESEARFRRLADALPQIVWMTDAEGRLDFHNARWYEYTDLPEDGASREMNSRFLHPDDEAKIQSAWQAAFVAGRPFEHEARIRNGRTGDYRWFLCRAVPVFDDAGQVARWFGTSTDIDDQKQTEEQLRNVEHSLRELNATLEERVAERSAAAEERARALVLSERELRSQTLVMQSILESMGDAVIVADKDGRIVLCNRAARNHYTIERGRSISSLTSEISRLFHNDGSTPYQVDELPLVRTLRGQSCDDVEIVVRSVDHKDSMTVSVTGRPLMGDDGSVEGGVIVIRDVTARKRILEQLRESEECLRKSFEFAAIGKAIVDIDGRFQRVNRSLCELLGYSESELIGLEFRAITYPADLAADLDLVRRLTTGEIRSYELEKRYIHRDGRLVDTLLSVSLVRDGLDRPLYFLSQIHNLTELKRAESERRRAAERTRFVEQTIIAGEAEQRRLARDLHDGVGQSLTSLRLGLRSIEDATDLEAARRSARELRRIAIATLDEVRALTKSLRPSVLDDLGLIPAVSRLISDLQLVNPLRVEFSTAGIEDRRFADVVETAVFRIAQEALTNIVRHAEATNATIDLRCTGSWLQLTVIDDGVGFDVGADAPGGNRFGLTGMRERASLLNGELTVQSTLGQGTRLMLRVAAEIPADRELAA